GRGTGQRGAGGRRARARAARRDPAGPTAAADRARYGACPTGPSKTSRRRGPYPVRARGSLVGAHLADPGMQRISVLFVCLGNICRSPMAEALFAALAESRGLGDRFHVDSAGTASYHTGARPHPRTVEVLRRHGIEATSVARTVTPEDF